MRPMAVDRVRDSNSRERYGDGGKQDSALEKCETVGPDERVQKSDTDGNADRNNGEHDVTVSLCRGRLLNATFGHAL